MSIDQLTQRIFNFSAGPAVLPVSVLEQVQTDLLCLPGSGASILEISHRSPTFMAILASAQQRIRQLLKIPEGYHVLLLQGGSRLQFTMTAMNLMHGATAPADYLVTGSWSAKAVPEAEREGAVRVLWNGKPTNYDRLPDWDALDFNPDAPYVYLTSNETIQGVQFGADLLTPTPLVCDSSSDFLSRPVSVSQYGLLYACAQKNAGPAGATVVIIRDDLLERSRTELPGYLNYQQHAQNDSMYNTPPTFAIYVLDLVCKWIQDKVGGLEKMGQQNASKAAEVYAVVDGSDGFYSGHAQTDCRSTMNVTFRLSDKDLESRFVAEARDHGLDGLKGHRSVGGIRASIYNAMPPQGVSALCQYMRDFMASNG